MKEGKITAALPDADHDLLGAFSESWFPLMTLLFPADIGFVNFDSTIKHLPIYFFAIGFVLPCRK